MAVRTITKENFEQEVLACKKPVLLLFMTESCEDSKKQLILWEKLSEELEDSVIFGIVDVNQSVGLAFQYQIMDTPTIVAMSYGIFRGRVKGIQTEEAIRKMIEDCGDGTFQIS
ncbi:MAG: thioredoxin family protein [Roseburia sp.]